MPYVESVPCCLRYVQAIACQCCEQSTCTVESETFYLHIHAVLHAVAREEAAAGRQLNLGSVPVFYTAQRVTTALIRKFDTILASVRRLSAWAVHGIDGGRSKGAP